jgi:hypothetical protein
MKKVLYLIFIASVIVGCPMSNNPAKKAEHLVWRNYRDCEKIIMVDVDTITLGDNLDYRIEQHKRHVEERESEVKMYKRYVKEFRSSKMLVESYKKQLHKSDSSLTISKRILADLDSLKLATIDKAGIPTAYQVCVAYNSPSNLVWIQMDADGTLLKMSKNRSELFFNPGADMPGYFEILNRYRK